MDMRTAIDTIHRYIDTLDESVPERPALLDAILTLNDKRRTLELSGLLDEIDGDDDSEEGDGVE